jgi:Ser/Thr protein kinase RdoA (MazF antagonist)
VADDSLQPVLSHYGLSGPGVRIEALANAGGWSGSLLWRITDQANRPFCLRRWPSEHPTTKRLEFIHSVLLHVGRELPIVAFPLSAHSGHTFIQQAGHLWELTSWMPGRADFHANPAIVRLCAAMQSLAKFHNSAARFGSEIGIASAVTDRLNQLQQLDSIVLSGIENSLSTPLDREIDGRGWQLLGALKQRLARPLPACPIGADSRLQLQPAIRDIHHDHVLFTGDSVTGLIDFGGMRIDTPLTDVARLVGSLVGDDLRARQTALAAYAESRPLTEIDRRLIDWLDHTATILGALNWLRWLYLERRDMGSTAPIGQRLEALARRLAIE